jgi:hypothetical protein
MANTADDSRYHSSDPLEREEEGGKKPMRAHSNGPAGREIGVGSYEVVNRITDQFGVKFKEYSTLTQK